MTTAVALRALRHDLTQNGTGVVVNRHDLVMALDEIERLQERAQELYDQYWEFVNHINDQYGYPRGMISPQGYERTRRT